MVKLWLIPFLIKPLSYIDYEGEYARSIQSNSLAIKPHRTPIVRLPNIIELTIKFCQSNTIKLSIAERLVIEPNRTFNYRTIGIIDTNAASYDSYVVLENSEDESEITANSLSFLRGFCWALKLRTEMSEMSNSVWGFKRQLHWIS